jgi:hypothetical protein
MNLLQFSSLVSKELFEKYLHSNLVIIHKSGPIFEDKTRVDYKEGGRYKGRSRVTLSKLQTGGI